MNIVLAVIYVNKFPETEQKTKYNNFNSLLNMCIYISSILAVIYVNKQVSETD